MLMQGHCSLAHCQRQQHARFAGGRALTPQVMHTLCIRTPTRLHIFHVQGSVEERIMAVTNKRRSGNGSAMAAAAVTELEYEGECGRVGRGRVRVEDLAGAIRADRQALRLSELDVLFQVFQLI